MNYLVFSYQSSSDLLDDETTKMRGKDGLIIEGQSECTLCLWRRKLMGSRSEMDTFLMEVGEKLEEIVQV